MPQNFIGCDRDQELLLPPSLKEWLPESHLAWFVLEAVGELDLDAFYVADQIVIAADISAESLDTASLQPMLETATAELQAAGVSEPLGLALADAGYWRNDAIEALLGQGIGILIAPDADRRKEPRPGRRGGRYDFARRVLATDYGKEIYLKRQGSVEPVFGQIKANRGANRFLRRGRSAVRSEWRLLTLTHNILKLHRHHLATA
jgi:hypothetical protein